MIIIDDFALVDVLVVYEGCIRRTVCGLLSVPFWLCVSICAVPLLVSRVCCGCGCAMWWGWLLLC